MNSHIDKGECETFDFIFIDADKENYINYYELSLKLIKKGGLIAIDNTLLFGTVFDETVEIRNDLLKKYLTKEAIQVTRKLNEIILKDDRVNSSPEAYHKPYRLEVLCWVNGRNAHLFRNPDYICERSTDLRD